MQEREILIANTKTQKRSKLTTNATTLGELKAAMAEADIDYSGMTFTEGISKTQLLDDATQLPQNVMYKGATTNNLVILLTNTKKNIASGMCDSSRQEAYTAIVARGLQEVVKNTFGRNYTQVPTSALWEVVNTYDSELEDIEDEEDLDDMEDSLLKCANTLLDSLYSTISALLNADILTVDEVDTFIEQLNSLVEEVEDEVEDGPSTVESSDGTITNDDIDDMVNELV